MNGKRAKALRRYVRECSRPGERLRAYRADASGAIRLEPRTLQGRLRAAKRALRLRRLGVRGMRP